MPSRKGEFWLLKLASQSIGLMANDIQLTKWPKLFGRNIAEAEKGALKDLVAAYPLLNKSKFKGNNVDKYMIVFSWVICLEQYT